jgi:hypothetical protein
MNSSLSPQSSVLAELPAIALSIRQPWAWLICNNYKPLENRDRKIGSHTGPLLIHAGARMTLDDYHAAFIFVASFDIQIAQSIPGFKELKELCGGIVGFANVKGISQVIGCGLRYDIIEQAFGPWWTGPVAYHFEAGASRCIPFKPCKGRLGFFPCNYEAL